MNQTKFGRRARVLLIATAIVMLSLLFAWVRSFGTMDSVFWDHTWMPATSWIEGGLLSARGSIEVDFTCLTGHNAAYRRMISSEAFVVGKEPHNGIRWIRSAIDPDESAVSYSNVSRWHGFAWFSDRQASGTGSSTFVTVGIPYWAVVLVALGLASGLALWIGRASRLRAAGQCVRCGYDLRASPGRCPECGADRG